MNQIPLGLKPMLMLPWLHVLLKWRLATDCFRPHKTTVYTSDSQAKPTAKTTSDSDQQRQYASLTLQAKSTKTNANSGHHLLELAMTAQFAVYPWKQAFIYSVH